MREIGQEREILTNMTSLIAFRTSLTCYRWKSTVLPGKLFFFQKTPKNCHFWWQGIWVTWLWEEVYAKLLGLGQLLGCPWKVWGITVQTSYWEGLWHQNCGYTSPILFFAVRHKNWWNKGTFLLITPYPKIFNGKIFWALHPENPYALSIPKNIKRCKLEM